MAPEIAVAGAIQRLAGMKAAKTIIASGKGKRPRLHVTDVGHIGDLAQPMSKLTGGS